MSPDEFRTWNEQMSYKYHPDDYHASSNVIVRWIEHKRVRSIFRQLDVHPEHRVLEVGVGTGTILQQISAKERVGIDLSAHYLAIARKRLGPDVELIGGNAEETSTLVAPCSFDRIYCSEVLEHVQHPSIAIQEMTAALKNHGILVISVPNDHLIGFCKKILRATGLYFLIFPNLSSADCGEEWHLHSFAMKDIRHLFLKYGLKVNKEEGIPFSWLPLRFVVCGKKES